MWWVWLDGRVAGGSRGSSLQCSVWLGIVVVPSVECVGCCVSSRGRFGFGGVLSCLSSRWCLVECGVALLGCGMSLCCDVLSAPLGGVL